MRKNSEMKVVVDPDAIERAKHPTTLMYQTLIDEGAPVKWKGGKPPKDRDAKPTDLETQAAVRIVGNVVEAMW